jgi:flagellar motor protein MotB
MKRIALAAIFLVACGGAGASSVPRVAEAERTRKGLEGREAQQLAPQAFAQADLELQQAKDAEAKGDATGAELHAERAVAAYADAVALARLARASQDEATATEALTRAADLAGQYGAQRKAIDREADDLEKKLRIAREAQLPAPSGSADPDRERARLVAAKALTTQARLLCSAARLVSAQAPGLGDAETAVGALEKQLDAGARTAAPIDPAARARAACLASLTKARRATTDATGTDTLLSELSQSADKKRDLAPTRDERGVVVTLRGAFKGTALSPEAEATIKELGRVAAAHPAFAVQVVVHDATAPGAAEAANDQKRGEAVAKALVDGGAASGKMKVEQAGARAPIVDPEDTKHRDRNARVEIVFISP